MDKNVISRAKKLAKSRTVSVINGNVYVKDGTAIATNIETSLMFRVPIQGEGVVPITVLESGFESAEIRNGVFYCEHKGVKHKLQAGNGEDFPLPYPADMKFGRKYNLDATLLHELAPFTSKDELRPAICGIYASKESNELVATDAHVLRRIKHNIDFNSVIFPADAVKYMPKQKAHVAFSEDLRRAMLTFDEEVLVVRLIDARFPNYAAVYPKSFEGKFEFNRDELIDNLVSASRVSKLSEKNVVVLAVNNNKMLIQAWDIDTGAEFSSTIQVKTNAKERFYIGFNCDLLLKTINICKGKNVKIEYVNNSKGVVIDDVNILMPVMIESEDHISLVNKFFDEYVTNTQAETPQHISEETEVETPVEAVDHISEESDAGTPETVYSAQEENAGNTDITFRINEELQGLEIAFDEKPDQAIIDLLKAAGFRWSRFNRVWYRKITPEVEKALAKIQ